VALSAILATLMLQLGVKEHRTLRMVGAFSREIVGPKSSAPNKPTVGLRIGRLEKRGPKVLHRRGYRITQCCLTEVPPSHQKIKNLALQTGPMTVTF